VVLHAAERGVRSAARFVARKPRLAHETVRFHVEVKAELLVRARLARAVGQEQPRACARRVGHLLSQAERAQAPPRLLNINAPLASVASGAFE